MATKTNVADKFTISGDVLKAIVSVASQAATSKSTPPVLEHLLFQVSKDGFLRVAGNNLAMCISVKTQIENATDDFAVAIPAAPLKKLANVIRDEKITFSYNSRVVSVTISANNSKATLKCLPANEFPPFPSIAGKVVPVSLQILKTVRSMVAPVASEDDTRAELICVRARLVDNKIIFDAADGYRLAQMRLLMGSVVPKEQTLLIPARLLLKAISVFPEGNEVNMSWNDSVVCLSGHGIEVYIQQVAGRYPDLDSLITKKNKDTIVVSANTRDVITGLAILESVKSDSSITKIELNGAGEMIVSAKNEDGAAEARIAISEEKGAKFIVGLSAKFFAQVIRSIRTETVKIMFQSDRTPITFLEQGNEDFVHIVMPMLIQEDEISGEKSGKEEQG